jgi:hypothetical protein
MTNVVVELVTCAKKKWILKLTYVQFMLRVLCSNRFLVSAPAIMSSFATQHEGTISPEFYCVIKHCTMKADGGVEIQLHHSWPQHYKEVSGQLHAPVALSPCPLDTGFACGPEPVLTLWTREEFFAHAENRTQTIQPVTYRYTA